MKFFVYILFFFFLSMDIMAFETTALQKEDKKLETEDVLDIPEVNQFLKDVAGPTAKAKISLPPDVSSDPEAGSKVFSIGRNDEGVVVLQSVMVIVGHEGDFSPVIHPDTIALVHVHYEGLIQRPHGWDHMPVRTEGIPSYVISHDGNEIWVVGRIEGEYKSRKISDEKPSEWGPYPSSYLSSASVMNENAKRSGANKRDLALIVGKPTKVDYIGLVELPNGGIFFGGWHEVKFRSFEVIFGNIESRKLTIKVTATHPEVISKAERIYVLLDVSDKGHPEAVFWDKVRPIVCVPKEVVDEFNMEPWFVDFDDFLDSKCQTMSAYPQQK